MSPTKEGGKDASATPVNDTDAKVPFSSASCIRPSQVPSKAQGINSCIVCGPMGRNGCLPGLHKAAL